MNKPFTLNIPISKIDEEQRMVWGVATSEAIDSQNDIVDYEASKTAFGAWLGNIREMHQPVAVGKAIDIQFDDVNKQVMIGAKISESTDGENAWIKVKEGVLTGFSIGGNVKQVSKEVAKDKNGVDTPVTRIVDYDLSETSLVDNPANPEAMLVMVKSQKGGLQRVEHEATDAELGKVLVPGWFMQFTPPIEKAQALYTNNMKKGNQTAMKKGLWDASFLLDLAIELGYYINSEQYAGEDVTDLEAALATLKAAVVKELTEATPELTTAVELAQKVTTLKKGKAVKKSVTGSEDRDENGKVVATAEQNGRPVNDTAERAAEAGVPAAGTVIVDKDGEPVLDENGKEQLQPVVFADAEAAKVEEAAPAAAEAPKAEEPKKVEVKTEEAPAAPAAEAVTTGTEAPAEGKASEPTVEAPAETDKAVTVGDLAKFTEGLLSKLGDSNKTELTKVLGELSGKVDEQFALLKGRLDKLESQPAAPKVQASYVTVEKGKEGGVNSEEVDVQALIKRRDELAADPNLGTPAERMELAQALRKAQANGAVIA